MSNRRPDAYIISFPKCGRTWLRMVLGKIFSTYYEINPTIDEIIELTYLHRYNNDIPYIVSTHDGAPHGKLPSEIKFNKNLYKDSKVILLIRDMRDLAVSTYFQLNKRSDRVADPYFSGSIDSYLDQDCGGVKSMIKFYNMWIDNRSVLGELLVIRYEDMHVDMHEQIVRILKLLKASIPDEIIMQSIDFCKFDNMRKIEINQQPSRLNPIDINDPESYKTRKGKIGGYVDYITIDQANEINKLVSQNLNPVFKYPYK